MKPFVNWAGGITINSGDQILFNNSFLYREKVSTNKSSKYLSLTVNDGLIQDSEIKVAQSTIINLDFKYFPQRAPQPITVSLLDAIHEELQGLGSLVFILIGEIDDSVDFTQNLNHSLFENVIFRPKLDKPLVIEGKSIIINDFSNTELLWNELTLSASMANLVQGDLPENLFTAFETTIKELRKNCYLRMNLPTQGKDLHNVFLDSINSALKQNTNEYRESLEKCDSNQHALQEFNNVLRIAYNFAGEAVTMLKLLVKVCDLKPILLWMTIKEQIDLLQAFRNLPSMKKDKPSVDEYVQIIGGARNRAFHHIFPFNHTIVVQLDGVAINAKHLRLFSEHRSKDKNSFEYQDKQMVEILTEFTRAEESYVSPDFWLRNLDVMTATINLLSATSDSLKCLNKIG